MVKIFSNRQLGSTCVDLIKYMDNPFKDYPTFLVGRPFTWDMRQSPHFLRNVGLGHHFFKNSEGCYLFTSPFTYEGKGNYGCHLEI